MKLHTDFVYPDEAPDTAAAAEARRDALQRVFEWVNEARGLTALTVRFKAVESVLFAKSQTQCAAELGCRRATISKAICQMKKELL